jgi:hypothetical protein
MMDISELNFRSRIENHIAGLHKRIAQPIPLWDDQVSQRIVSSIEKILGA